MADNIKKDIPGFEGTGDAFGNLVSSGESLIKKYKSPIEQSEAIQKESAKPLHVRSLEHQVAQNPKYEKIAKAVAPNDEQLYDSYFYALKDAFEKNAYNPSDDQIRDELVDAYYRANDDFIDRHGKDYGQYAFENVYGSEDSFIQKLFDALRKERGDI